MLGRTELIFAGVLKAVDHSAVRLPPLLLHCQAAVRRLSLLRRTPPRLSASSSPFILLPAPAPTSLISTAPVFSLLPPTGTLPETPLPPSSSPSSAHCFFFFLSRSLSQQHRSFPELWEPMAANLFLPLLLLSWKPTEPCRNRPARLFYLVSVAAGFFSLSPSTAVSPPATVDLRLSGVLAASTSSPIFFLTLPSTSTRSITASSPPSLLLP